MVDFNEVEVILAYLLFCGTQGLNNVFVVLWYTGTQQCICCFVVHRDSTMYLRCEHFYVCFIKKCIN